MLRIAVVAGLLLVSAPVFAQLAATTRAVAMHRAASTKSATMEHLPAGTRLMLVEMTPRNGLYHVRTEDEEVGWVTAKAVTHQKSPHTPGQPQIPDVNLAAHPGCDPSLWNHVYHSQRLIVKQSCIEVTGKIVDATNGKKPDGVRHEADGDTHGWLNVDPQFKNLLNAGNIQEEGGNLVFEIVCKFPVTQADAVSACKGYQSNIQIPPVGSHVRIIGSYDLDTNHAQWMEIHPVTKIELIQ